MERRGFVLGSVASVLAGCTTTPAPAPEADAPKPQLLTPALNPGDMVVGGSQISVVFDGEPYGLPRASYEAWVRRSAQMITDYYEGSFPVPSLEVTIVPRGRGGVGFGSHRQGRWVRVYCGRATGQRSLENDWVMVHEMLHATFPDLTDEHRWMQEGLSTYAEKIVRIRAGNITEENMWSRLSGSMHHGRPRAGDRGLDKTHTWGRTYWGGALFWMVADVELRRGTDNRKSLDDVLRHVASIGGNARQMWEPQRVCKAADEGTGTQTVSQLYERMAKAPGDIDLDRFWADLGVIRAGDDTVEFDDTAALAHVRRGIASGRAG
ncbi:MAG: hypothetical protein ACRBN8_42895 [Nannocystales bacterium]